MKNKVLVLPGSQWNGQDKTGYYAQAEGMASVWSHAETRIAVKLKFMIEYETMPFEWEFVDE